MQAKFVGPIDTTSKFLISNPQDTSAESPVKTESNQTRTFDIALNSDKQWCQTARVIVIARGKRSPKKWNKKEIMVMMTMTMITITMKMEEIMILCVYTPG